MINFASDNYSPVHPDVLRWLSKVNEGPSPAYGNDSFTKEAQDHFKKYFGNDSESFFVWNGTSANVLGLSALLKPFQSIICTDVSHILVDECGAPEKHLGSKLVPIKTRDGKLSPELIEPTLARLGDVHSSQAKVISITQATEYGTLYSIEELKALTQFAKKHHLSIHMDGARISNAAVALNCSFKEMTTDIGIDIVSFGGTKNGLMGAEAVVFTKAELAKQFPYIRKQGLHLSSKMRFLSAQFLAYFENELWKRNAENANQMAQYFSKQLSQISEVSLSQKVQANGIFATLPRPLIHALQKQFSFYVWNEARNEVRFMCSFNTKKEEIDAFIGTLKEAGSKQ